ncbi:MAG: fibrobacter succinogenes major paralogous domain-containing protein, partial [Muribaculaceae bacterium]|nr:fibrobacter succinogenes major paralogous domain-containing protein [Muribaculaceae bacterium]
YYRVDLRKKNDKGTGYKYLFLTPNHEYQITIKGVKAKGYATEAEAAKHPQEDLVDVEIVDCVPAVLSMAADGQHELGVETPVNMTDKAGSFALKLNSKISESEYPTNMAVSADGKTIVSRDAQNKADGKLKIEVVSGEEWLRLTGISDPSGSDGGKLYDVNVKSVSNLSVGQLTGEVKVTWMGLTRDVEIVWDQPFNIESIMTAQLEMNNNGTTTTVSNYWKFLDENYSGTHAMGISKAMNCGKVRNQGIHLPVGIGGKNSGNYSYKYTLTLAGDYKTKKLKSVKIYNKQNGTEIVPQELSYRQGSGSTATTITITADANSLGKQYFTGRMELVFEENGVEEQLPDIDIYHTGFFWKVSSSDSAYKHAIDGKKPTQGWYYYEIRTFGNRMWLDRNLCAKSSGMAIITNSNGGSMYIPDGTGDFKSEAIGSYYLPAAYNTSRESAEKHLYTDLCPPGFRIPKTNEWDEIRNSNAFRSTETEAGGYTYFQSRLRDDDGNMIYLPKGMYYNGSTLVGDSRAGYYWTATEAAGLEKDQIGRWLQALMLSGGSNSYMYGNIEDYG